MCGAFVLKVMLIYLLSANPLVFPTLEGGEIGSNLVSLIYQSRNVSPFVP